MARMKKRLRLISLLLAMVMVVSLMTAVAPAAIAEEAEEEPIYVDYDVFLEQLKVLEGYASSYAEQNGGTVVGLSLNYIRSGIEKYTSDSWAVLAGAINEDFIAYVDQQNATNGTSTAMLMDLGLILTPYNNEQVELSHLIGVLSIANYNPGSITSADFGSWAGDLVDLMEYSKTRASGADVETLSADIRMNLLGVDDSTAHSFGIFDIRADLDAYLINEKLKTDEKLSTAMEDYYVSSTNMISRSVGFLNLRFTGKTTKEDIRAAILDAYRTNSGVILLEADRGLSNDTMLREATCYAWADYLFALADGFLEGGDDPTPDNPDDPTPGESDLPSNDYYSVFSSKDSVLAPGVTQTVRKAITADSKQIVYYVATVDVSRDDLTVYANYHNNDPSAGWGMARVSDQVSAFVANHADVENLTPVVATNADFYSMTTGRPSGALVMEGVEYNGRGSENFFAILNDGTPLIGGQEEWNANHGQIKEAVGGGAVIVKNGEIFAGSSTNYYKNRASRTCIGLTEDNKVVMMVLDGRQEPFSAGGSLEEIAQIMIDAGCVTAINLDGGGSSCYMSKEEGSDDIAVRNRPSDGFERSVSSSLVVISTAASSTTFDHAVIETEHDYLMNGASVDVEITGVSISGGAAEIPEGASLRLSDETIAALDGSTITATAYGDITVELVLGDTVIGSKQLHVVLPDRLYFTKANLTAVYGSPMVMPLEASYQGSTVALNLAGIITGVENPDAGTVEGLVFTPTEGSGIRVVRIGAALQEDTSVYVMAKVDLYENGEAFFDFDNVTEGDRSLAWVREVSNSETPDDKYYHVVDPTQEMEAGYVFALDMQEIQIPEQIKPMMALLPGGDQQDAAAWTFLLQLAERVSIMTNVLIQVDIDPNLDVDITDLKIVNDYFSLTDASFDPETHVLTVVANFINQTQAIDPATANPICILSGLKVKPSEDAAWINGNVLNIHNSGNVSYGIYLRSSTLYNIAQRQDIQETYGIYPFENPDVIVAGGGIEKGGYFSSTYKDFLDEFTLDRTNRNGWYSENDYQYYYQNNVLLTGIQLLPDPDDASRSYYYDLGENGACKGKVNGLFDMNGETYYAGNGELLAGWRLVQDEDGNDLYYYFNRQTYAAVDGEQTISGYHYVFENKVLVKGEWLNDDEGNTQYVWAGVKMCNRWFTVDGNEYFAFADYNIAKGLRDTLNHERTKYVKHAFDDNGVWQGYSGFFTYEGNGETYLLKEGIVQLYPGLVEFEGNYYYFKSDNTMVKGRNYYVSRTNGLLPAGQYTFAADGKLVIIPESEKRNGIVKETEDLWYYYVDDVKTYAGLIEIDGDLYYVKSNFEVVHGQDYYISKTNGLLPQGKYNFDADGKLVIVPESEKRNGIVKETEDLWYYYVDDVKTYAGLIQIDGDYYYVKTDKTVVHGQDYYISKTNGLLPQGKYTFDADGKLVMEENGQLLNGIVKEPDGTWYYYVNGAKTYAGLIQIDGDYYYVKTDTTVVHGQRYYVSKTNGLMPQDWYVFDDEGKMVLTQDPTPTVKNGIVKDGDVWTYYVNDVPTYAGLIEIDGDYYYVKTDKTVVHGMDYGVSKTNNLMAAGTYTFDEEGKMLRYDGILKNGDTWYYYNNSMKSYAGVIEIDGDYYYVKSDMTVVHGRSYYVSKTNGLVPAGNYAFDADGKMILN